MKIVTAGDSFTYGEELADLNSAWPFVLAKLCGDATCVNLGKPAASNDKIIRLLMSHLMATDQVMPDLVVIGWTSAARIEWADDYGTYDVWPGYGGNLFTRDSATWRRDLVDYISKFHSSAYIHQRFLQQVILMQSFLESKGIRYVMLNTIQNEYYKKSFFPEQPWYFEHVNKTNFLGFDKEGMAEWTHEVKKGPHHHFLEEGHQIVAKKVYEHIRDLGWVS